MSKINILREKLRGVKHAPFFDLRKSAEDAIEFSIVILEDQERRLLKLERELLVVSRG